jgi:hypothetical protein
MMLTISRAEVKCSVSFRSLAPFTSSSKKLCMGFAHDRFLLQRIHAVRMKAIESAGIVLVRSDPRDVVGAVELSRATYRKMIQNLVWATAYNLVAIPVAAGLFVPWGLDLPMSVGAVAMSLSTIIVAGNAQLLRGLKLQREVLR